MSTRFHLEGILRRHGIGPVAGVDEAGRGACAGPLVVAAVVLGHQIRGLRDSKLLRPEERERLASRIKERAQAWSIVEVPPKECDRFGLHVMNVEAMRRAVWRLDPPPEFVLTDGYPIEGLGRANLAVWKGDAVAACIAAASILAKVHRDAVMTGLASTHPEYGFEVHKGYSTASHQAVLERLGPTPVHRWSYANVAKAARLGSR